APETAGHVRGAHPREHPRCRTRPAKNPSFHGREGRVGRTGRSCVHRSLVPGPPPTKGLVSGTNGVGLLARGRGARLPGPAAPVQWHLERSAPIAVAIGPLTVAGPRRLLTGPPLDPVPVVAVRLAPGGRAGQGAAGNRPSQRPAYHLRPLPPAQP